MRVAAFRAFFDLNILPQFFSGLSLVKIFLTVLTNRVLHSARRTFRARTQRAREWKRIDYVTVHQVTTRCFEVW
jgi:hypothetical protein